MTDYELLQENTHEAWAATEQARRDFRAAYNHLHESDYKMLVNLIFEFADDLGYELQPRKPHNDSGHSL